MSRNDKSQKAFNFLVECAKNDVPFTLEDLANAADWTIGNTKTNISKRLTDIVYLDGKGIYKVKQEIFRVRFDDFCSLYKQKNRLFTDYKLSITNTILIYEFFMPLSREDRLREALDGLFYKETLYQRILEIGAGRIQGDLHIEDIPERDIPQYIYVIVDKNIGGYSLYIVNGRFRSGPLTTKKEIADREYSSGPYLIDETTAVVRFILPVELEDVSNKQKDLFDLIEDEPTIESEAAKLRWIFLNFFAEAIVKTVKEDEIWLVESGMKNSLYKWSRNDDD